MGQDDASKNEQTSLAGSSSRSQAHTQELQYLANLFLQLDTQKRCKILKQFEEIAQRLIQTKQKHTK